MQHDWASPSQAEDWSSDWRPPHWGEDKNPFSEDNINRDSVGKFAAQRQLPRARDKSWRSPRQDTPSSDERNIIEDARIKALDYARQILGRDTHSTIRIAADCHCDTCQHTHIHIAQRAPKRHRLMAFDHALVRRALKSQIVTIAMDFRSMRTFSADGHMHVERSNISRASVNPYLGREIPDSENMGLAPNQKYMLLRHPDELAKSAPSFNGIPILIDHRPISADDHPSNLVVGATGTDAAWSPPFLTNSLHIWDQNAIDAINNNERKELSCAYHYTPDMTPGIWEGKRYDGIMRDISGNHVALVPDGRVGPVAVVADAMPFDLAYGAWFGW